jgi:hypothetical protein
MTRRVARGWWQTVAASVLPLLLLGCSFVGPTGAHAQASFVVAEPPSGIRMADFGGYQPIGSLGFRLLDTTIAEQAYRRVESGERGLVWTAQFTSQWPLTEDRLDRWSAQAIGNLADGLGPGVQLGGWERLPSDVGDQRVAYRYRLTSADGASLGEATLVVFARGSEVGITGTAGLNSSPPVDATALARALDAPRS